MRWGMRVAHPSTNAEPRPRHTPDLPSAAARDNGIESVKSNGPTPTVKDNT